MIRFEQRFDRRRMFQYINDEPSVLHCHHYATLFTKVAIDQINLGGPRLLAESMEDAFFLVLKKFFIHEEIQDRDERTRAAEEYSVLTGLGKLRLSISKDGGSAEMSHSHVDEGWIQKWSRTDHPVNFIGQGYIAAACAAVTDNPPRSFDVSETASIVTGEPISRFSISRRGAGQ